MLVLRVPMLKVRDVRASRRPTVLTRARRNDRRAVIRLCAVQWRVVDRAVSAVTTARGPKAQLMALMLCHCVYITTTHYCSTGVPCLGLSTEQR